MNDMKILKCKKCKKELKGGFYNTPSGLFCVVCWEGVSPIKKDKALSDVLNGLAYVAKMFKK